MCCSNCAGDYEDPQTDNEVEERLVESDRELDNTIFLYVPERETEQEIELAKLLKGLFWGVLGSAILYAMVWGIFALR